MKKTTKKWIALSTAVAMTGMMAVGCTGKTASVGTNADATAEQGEIKIGIIYSESGLSGNSFDDMALEGVKRAAEDFDIVYDEVEPGSVSDMEIIQDEMASSGEYELIICIGSGQVDGLNNVAATYSDQKFALLDAEVDLDNVASYSFREHEATFIVGALAALAKEEQADDKLNDGATIGFIGGLDVPLINRFAAGYKAGAQYINPDMNVLVDYAGGFTDPTTAKTIANTFNEKGADIVFHAAGASGMGVFQAAEETGFVAIGVNLNQNTYAPDYIMASMLKRMDSCAYHAIKSVVEGTYTGEDQVLGLAEEGVDVTLEGSNIQVSDAVLERIEEIRQLIIDGEIEVPEEL
jgi:basic membrane protein A